MGNIVFQSKEDDTRKIGASIRDRIQEKYGFEVPVLVREPVDFKRVIENNPIAGDPGKEIRRLYVTF